jgi:hypothetical protein
MLHQSATRHCETDSVVIARINEEPTPIRQHRIATYYLFNKRTCLFLAMRSIPRNDDNDLL